MITFICLNLWWVLCFLPLDSLKYSLGLLLQIPTLYSLLSLDLHISKPNGGFIVDSPCIHLRLTSLFQLHGGLETYSAFFALELCLGAILRCLLSHFFYSSLDSCTCFLGFSFLFLPVLFFIHWSDKCLWSPDCNHGALGSKEDVTINYSLMLFPETLPSSTLPAMLLAYAAVAFHLHLSALEFTRVPIS